MRRVAMSFLLGLGASAASAAMVQPVYRCGNAYSDAPCAAAKRIDADDARTDAQRADAARLAADDKRLARQMTQERLAAQAVSDRAAAKSVKTKAPKRPHATKIKWVRL